MSTGKTDKEPIRNVEDFIIELEPRLALASDSVLRMAETCKTHEIDQATLYGLASLLGDLLGDFALLKEAYYKEWEEQRKAA